MKFHHCFRVCLIFTHTILRTSKSIGNNTMKKMLLSPRYRVGSCHCRMRARPDVYCSKQPAAVAPKETITHHFFVSGIGQKKTVDAAKICGGAENVNKNRNLCNIRKWMSVLLLRYLYSAGSACVLLTIYCTSCPSIWATLSALLINILGFLPVVFA